MAASVGERRSYHSATSSEESLSHMFTNGGHGLTVPYPQQVLETTSINDGSIGSFLDQLANEIVGPQVLDALSLASSTSHDSVSVLSNDDLRFLTEAFQIELHDGPTICLPQQVYDATSTSSASIGSAQLPPDAPNRTPRVLPRRDRNQHIRGTQPDNVSTASSESTDSMRNPSNTPWLMRNENEPIVSQPQQPNDAISLASSGSVDSTQPISDADLRAINPVPELRDESAEKQINELQRLWRPKSKVEFPLGHDRSYCRKTLAELGKEDSRWKWNPDSNLSSSAPDHASKLLLNDRSKCSVSTAWVPAARSLPLLQNVLNGANGESTCTLNQVDVLGQSAIICGREEVASSDSEDDSEFFDCAESEDEEEFFDFEDEEIEIFV